MCQIARIRTWRGGFCRRDFNLGLLFMCHWWRSTLLSRHLKSTREMIWYFVVTTSSCCRDFSLLSRLSHIVVGYQCCRNFPILSRPSFYLFIYSLQFTDHLSNAHCKNGSSLTYSAWNFPSSTAFELMPFIGIGDAASLKQGIIRSHPLHESVGWHYRSESLIGKSPIATLLHDMIGDDPAQNPFSGGFSPLCVC